MQTAFACSSAGWDPQNVSSARLSQGWKYSTIPRDPPRGKPRAVLFRLNNTLQAPAHNASPLIHQESSLNQPLSAYLPICLLLSSSAPGKNVPNLTISASLCHATELSSCTLPCSSPLQGFVLIKTFPFLPLAKNCPRPGANTLFWLALWGSTGLLALALRRSSMAVKHPKVLHGGINKCAMQ